MVSDVAKKPYTLVLDMKLDRYGTGIRKVQRGSFGFIGLGKSRPRLIEVAVVVASSPLSS
jgi:hypothetical protein